MDSKRCQAAVAHRLLILSILYLAGLCLGADLATADIVNLTVVGDGPLFHLAFVDYVNPVGGAGLVDLSANWRIVISVTDLDPDGIRDDVAVVGKHLIAPHPELGELAPMDYVGTHWESNLLPGDERDLVVQSLSHRQGPHLDWLQTRVDHIDNGVSRIWYRMDHTSSGDNPPPLPPRKPPTSISVQYFRGSCTAGSLGNSCNVNSDCGVGGVCNATAGSADDLTFIGGLVGSIKDLYRGQIIPGTSLGEWQYPNWIVNVSSCWNPPFADWINPDTGYMDQTLDPNPPLDTATYYDYTVDTGFGSPSNVNNLGCSNPSVCVNPGWCERGLTPGAPCAVDVDCGGGGVCIMNRTSCASHAGSALAGGCSSHPVCVAGVNVGSLCVVNTDCPGSSCAAPAAPAGLCANVSLYPGLISSDGCPPVGATTRVIRKVSAAVSAGCP
jgi:hypothetical protein